MFMKITYKEWINRLNHALITAEQYTRVVEYGKQTLTLSTGDVLTDSNFTRFKKRVLSTNTDKWVTSIDQLLNGSVSEKDIKSYLSAIGGFACQRIHGEKLKKNLNTGVPWSKGLKGSYPYSSPCSDATKRKISEKNQGERNGMYGTVMSAEKKQEKSQLMHAMILAGTFTPNSNNRNTHWDAEYNGKKYRSSWEALYQYINPVAEYEKFRIEYMLDGKNKIYIVDFIDNVNKLVIEVKPRELCVGDKFNAKINALTGWATTNNYAILIVDKEWFRSRPINIDYSKFDIKTSKKIKKIYEIKN